MLELNTVFITVPPELAEPSIWISPPELENQNFEILVTAKDEEGNEAESTFTLILLDESNIAYLDEDQDGESENEEEISEDSTPVDSAMEALLEEFNEVTQLGSDNGFVPFTKQLQDNLKTELDARALELIKNMYAA